MSTDQDKVAQLKARSEALLSQLDAFNREIQAVKSSPLAADSALLEAVTAIENELGISLHAKERVGTWPIDGPGNVACSWCTAGGGR